MKVSSFKYVFFVQKFYGFKFFTFGVQHMIDEGFRYPSLTELNGGQSMLYTPVHPGYDILWSPKRKWAVCLWTLVVGFTDFDIY